MRLCEWDVVKRAVDGDRSDRRPGMIVALGSAMPKFAVVAAPIKGIVEPEHLADTPASVTTFDGSYFKILKMLQGFLRKDEIKVANAGTMPERLEAVLRGELAAAGLSLRSKEHV